MGLGRWTSKKVRIGPFERGGEFGRKRTELGFGWF